MVFQYHDETRTFYSELEHRLNTFNLDVAPEKTSKKRFSCVHAGEQRTFEFLGFQFYFDTDFKGEPRLRRKMGPKKYSATLAMFCQWMKMCT